MVIRIARVSFLAAVISAPESGNTLMLFVLIEDNTCTSMVEASSLLVCVITYICTYFRVLLRVQPGGIG